MPLQTAGSEHIHSEHMIGTKITNATLPSEFSVAIAARNLPRMDVQDS